jgi:hypothetical protein
MNLSGQILVTHVGHNSIVPSFFYSRCKAELLNNKLSKLWLLNLKPAEAGIQNVFSLTGTV